MARRFRNSPEEVESATRAIFLDIWRSAEKFASSGLNELNFIALIAGFRLYGELKKPREQNPGRIDPRFEFETAVLITQSSI